MSRSDSWRASSSCSSGPNGAGKSTLVQFAVRPPAAHPPSGTIGSMAADVPGELLAHDAARRRPFVSAHEPTLPPLTVLENVRLAVQGGRNMPPARLAPAAVPGPEFRTLAEEAPVSRRWSRLGGERKQFAGSLSPGHSAPARDQPDARLRGPRRCCCSTSRGPAWGRRSPSAFAALLKTSAERGHDILLIEHDMGTSLFLPWPTG